MLTETKYKQYLISKNYSTSTVKNYSRAIWWIKEKTGINFYLFDSKYEISINIEKFKLSGKYANYGTQYHNWAISALKRFFEAAVHFSEK